MAPDGAFFVPVLKRMRTFDAVMAAAWCRRSVLVANCLPKPNPSDMRSSHGPAMFVARMQPTVPATLRDETGPFDGPFPFARLIGLHELNRFYHSLNRDGLETHFFERVLQALHISLDVADQELLRIPSQGPTIIVSNHPFGALDGLVAGALASRRHSNVRVLANGWLTKIPELKPWLLSVDVLGERPHALANAIALRSALCHLRREGLLVVFPAGVVSHLQPGRPGIQDPPWNRVVATLARKTRATVVPVHFEGQNSWLFQLLGLIHPTLRTALLPRELLRRRRSSVSVRIGHPVTSHAIAAFADDAALTAWLRLRTYALAPRRSRLPSGSTRTPASIVNRVPLVDIEREIGQLCPEALLVQQGRYRVYAARAPEVSRTLIEIGRLRELTFRAVGEGTGAALDIDRFDGSYVHLFVYDVTEKCIAGGYRLGFCDELLRTGGPAGLYTNTLFQFDASFVRALGHTIELGRSFVSAEYQRSPLALALLWRGIGELLVRHPRYEQLMGPVSISGSYDCSARRLMVSYLENLEKDAALRRGVRGRRPPRERLPAHETARILSFDRNLRQLTRLVADIDTERRGIPVLLERYLELGGQVLALNVDPDFGHCVDALIVVDVPHAPETILRRFLGAAGLERYARARLTNVGLSA